MGGGILNLSQKYIILSVFTYFLSQTFLNILCNIASQAFTGIQDENADTKRIFAVVVQLKCIS